MGLTFNTQLRKNFLNIAHQHSERIKIIDGNRSQENVAAQIIESIINIDL